VKLTFDRTRKGNEAMLDELLRMKAKRLRNIDSDDLLSMLGLERRHTALDAAIPTGLAFLAGAAAGAGIALLLAPKSGREVRQDLSNRASELSGQLSSAASEVADQVRQALPGDTHRDPARAATGAGTNTRSPS
jgi:hypothetical protein